MLLLSLLRSVWAIEPTYAEAYFPLVRAIITKDLAGIAEFKTMMQKDKAENALSKTAAIKFETGIMTGYQSLADAPEGSIAVISLVGPVQKYDDSMSDGTKTLMAQMKAAQASPNIIGAILLQDSGGGEVAGTLEFTDYIKNGFSKPKISFTDGLNASASFMISSACDERYASSQMAEIGSIGTVFTIRDHRQMDANSGLTTHVLYATKSTKKNMGIIDAMDGKPEFLRENLLDPMNEIFHATVRANMPGVNEEVFTGQLYLAQGAIDMGLIHGIKTLEQCVERCQELAQESKSITLTF